MKRLIRHLSLATAGVAALVALSPAAHAQATGGTITDFTNNTGSGGSFTTGFSASPLTDPFTSTLLFSTATSGTLSIRVDTIATTDLNDLDFTSVFLSGGSLAAPVQIFQTSGDPIETNALAGLAVGPGDFTLTVTGTPGTENGSFSGTVAFAATSAVPEPATWGMMLLGFGAVGFSMRRKRPSLMQAA